MSFLFLLSLLPFFSVSKERSVTFSASGQSCEIKLSSAGGDVLSTVIVFPEDSIQTIVSGWTNDELSVVIDGGRLFLRLLKSKDGFLDVVGSSGFLYRLYLIDSKGEYDTFVRIEKQLDDKKFKRSAIDVMKAMKMGVSLKGATIVKYEGDPIYEKAFIKIYLLYQYRYGFYTGYIFKIENMASDSYEVDVTRFRNNKLLLIGTSSYVIEPKNKGYIFCVFYN